jgi:hypothetical protein
MAIPFDTFTVTPVSDAPDKLTAVVGAMVHVSPVDDAVCIIEKEPPPTNVFGPGFKNCAFARVFVTVNVTGLEATPFGLYAITRYRAPGMGEIEATVTVACEGLVVLK